MSISCAMMPRPGISAKTRSSSGVTIENSQRQAGSSFAHSRWEATGLFPLDLQLTSPISWHMGFDDGWEPGGLSSRYRLITKPGRAMLRP